MCDLVKIEEDGRMYFRVPHNEWLKLKAQHDLYQRQRIEFLLTEKGFGEAAIVRGMEVYDRLQSVWDVVRDARDEAAAVGVVEVIVGNHERH